MKRRVQQRGLSLSKFEQFINQNPNADLREVLDQDDILESKQNCKVFGKFVIQNPERYWQLLQIINLQPNQNEEAIPNKYPFIVSEIIGYKEDQIINYLFDQNGPEEFEFLNLLFKTIDRDFIDNTLAGYLAKILKAIIEKRGLSLWKYLTNQQKESSYVIKDLIKHLDVQHIADIIFQLIRLDTVREQGQELYLNERLNLLQRVICYLQQKSNFSMIVENVSYILENLITETFEIEERMQFMQKMLTSALNYDTIVISKSSQLVQVLILLLEQIQRDNTVGKDTSNYNYSLIQEFSNNLVDLLNLNLYITPFQTSYGINQEPLGEFKLQLIVFYLKVIKLNEPNIMPYFSHQNICFAIMQLILKHEFNNSIQNLFLEIAQLVMLNNDNYDIQQDYIKANITGFLIYLNQYPKYQVGQIKKLVTKGYQGMANKLSYILSAYFQDETWKQYIESQQQIFQNENTYLLDQNPNYIEDQEKEKELIQSIKFDQNIEQKESSSEQQTQQPIIQQPQQDFQQQIISQQLDQQNEQQMIQQNSQNVVQLNTNFQPSIQQFGSIDLNNQKEKWIANQEEKINESIKLEEDPGPQTLFDEPRNVQAELQQAILSNTSQNPDDPDSLVVRFNRSLILKKYKSANLEEIEIDDGRRRTQSIVLYKKTQILQRKSSDQTFETGKKLSSEFLTPKKQYIDQVFSPLLQNQSALKNK